jgi:putative FmdB family regulatory protein
MPFYLYACGQCGGEKQLMRKVVDRDAPVECKACADIGAPFEPMNRRIAAPSFTLKGGGWYADGYTKKN